MGTAYKIAIITLVVVGFVFARSGKSIQQVVKKNVKSEHYFIKNDSQDNVENKLERKRSHKRRRKMRKPVKGLR